MDRKGVLSGDKNMSAIADESIVHASVKIERQFFTLVRWFGLLVTALALVGVVVSCLVAVGKMTSKANEHMRQPTATYADYMQVKEHDQAVHTTANVDDTLERKEQEAAKAAAEVEYLRRLKPHLDLILNNLTLYAAKVDVGKPSAQAVGDYVRRNMTEISSINNNEDLAWGYVDSLEKASTDLTADGERIAKFGINDARRVRWDEFIAWHANAFKEQIVQEKRRINGENIRIAEEKASALFNLYAAGGAFAVFVTATILLVLLRIERNTRATPIKSVSEQKNKNGGCPVEC